MRLVNLTPHKLILHFPDGVREVEPSGTVARLEAVTEPDPNDPGTVIERLGDVTGLPDPEHGTLFVVSRLVAQALALTAPDRDDVRVPGDLLRDKDGRVIGAKGLRRIVR